MPGHSEHRPGVLGGACRKPKGSGLGFRGLGFRGLGFRGLGYRGLGFRGLGRRVTSSSRRLPRVSIVVPLFRV